ncbi:MAG TPA: AAA family ATPase [Acidimicrobiales bacterium]|nr:AAA family ATPase [Acidimicrobiales bacterium]
MAAGSAPASLPGRDREWARIARAVDGGGAGRGGVLLLAGEPGIGKTALLTEALAFARSAGATTAVGVCVPGVRPYWPWRQVLATLGTAAVLDASVGGEASRAQLFEAVDGVLATEAARATLVLAFDDLQWADVPSLRLLALVARSAPSRALVVLGTFRDVEVGPDHPLGPAIGDIGAAGSVVSLAGLPPTAVQALMAAHAPQLTAEQAGAVHLRTGGNPFFVREVAHLAAADPASIGRVPPGVGEVVRRQVEACAEPARRLLEAAAVAWAATDLGLVGRALGVPATALVGPAEDLCRARLLVPEQAGYRFRHDIVRDAVLAGLGPGRRAELAWALGTALLARGDRARAGEAAALLRAGASVGGAGGAIAASLDAARQAAEALAYEPAVDHLTWVVHQYRAASVEAGPAELAHALVALGEARLGAGDWASAGDAFAEAAAAAKRAARPDLLARAALGFGAGLSGFEVPLRDRRQIELLEEAAAATAGADRADAAYVLARLSVALSGTGRLERRRQLAADAVAMAERIGDSAALGHALAAWCDGMAGPDHVEDRLAASARIVAAGRDASLPSLVLLGHRFGVVARLERGDIDGASHEIAAFAALAPAAPPLVRWYVPLWRGMQALLGGHLEQAAALADQADEDGARAGSANAAILAKTLRFAIADHAGRGVGSAMAAELDALCTAALADDPANCQVRGLALALAWNVGDLAGLRHHLDRLVAEGFGPRDAEWTGTVWAGARAALLLGDVDAARQAASLLQPYPRLWIVDGIGAALYGVNEEVLAAVALLTGDDAEAAGRLAAVAASYDAVGAPLLAERARRWTVVVRGDPRPPRPGADVGVLRCDGPAWFVSWGGRSARIPDGKGVRDLAVLLARPGAEVAATDLAGAAVGAALRQAAGDQQAIAAYRARARDLQAEVDRATASGEPGRATRARVELDALVDHLGASLGLGGRPRALRDDHERARQAVRARIRYAIDRIAEVHPALGRHLDATVRTGSSCSYRPERPATWQVRG